MKKVCVFTGTRAEYGLLRWVMEAIRSSEGLELQVIASGSHYSAPHGWTYREIESDGFRIDRKVEMLLASDSPVAVNKSMALGQMGVAEALEELKPDILMVLGDRYEALAATVAGLLMRVPVGHIHGGETTEGALDDSIRHAITKLSNLHFVATQQYRETVIQMGEDPDFVHLVGGLGVEAALRYPRLSAPDLAESLGVEWKQSSMLVTFHPVTTESAEESVSQMRELLRALELFEHSTIIITRPNADEGHSGLNREIDCFVSSHPNARAYCSLGSQRYLSCMAKVDVVVGNSSSALLEAPAFQKPAVNIGNRQKGRIRAENVIDCPPIAGEINDAIRTAFSPEFTTKMHGMHNPFGDGKTGEKIARILKETDLKALRKKGFHKIGRMAASHG
jgi:GDP/UDP-N,N'-diacetylbacillosamine 2-epimerase (hydrolysing)